MAALAQFMRLAGFRQWKDFPHQRRELFGLEQFLFGLLFGLDFAARAQGAMGFPHAGIHHHLQPGRLGPCCRSLIDDP